MTRWHLTGLDEQPAGVGGQGALELPLLHPAPPLPLLHGVGTPLLEIEQVTSLFYWGLTCSIFSGKSNASKRGGNVKKTNEPL